MSSPQDKQPLPPLDSTHSRPPGKSAAAPQPQSIQADIVAEAQRICAAASRQGLQVRLIGGVAVRLHAPSASHPALQRAYADVDLVTDKAGGRHLGELFTHLGYEPDRAFNLLQGNERQLFYDPAHQRQVDVFVQTFNMCHRLPLGERLHLEPLTLPLAELLLTKLQIVQLNEKDVRDVSALLLDHAVGPGDQETINGPRVASLCAEDWGLFKTVSLNLAKVVELSAGFALHPDEHALIQERAARLQGAIEAYPKTLKWKVRAKIGERVQWYELPEEAH